jgi:glycosyltransferase involved in cell wall biosynthesis
MSVAVSVVCPFYNEEVVIVEATRRMISNLRRQFDSWELILVNDGSTDRSLELLIETLKEDRLDQTTVLSCPRNQGRGWALKAGIDAAQGDIIVTIEADCSWGDDIVARLVREIDAHPEVDFVIASPHLPGGGLVNVPRQRVFLSRYGNRLISAFFRSDITMNTGMTRAYRRAVIQPLTVSEHGKEFHLEVLLKLVTLGFKGREIPATITWQKHRLTRSAHGGRRSSTDIRKIIATHLRFVAIAQPMRYFAYFSGLSFAAGICLLAASAWMLLAKQTAVFLALLGLLMLMFCLLFTGFSVIFIQLRESLREQWMRDYPGTRPPSSRPSAVVFPPRVKAE